MNKKEILKKYCGQGGKVKDTFMEIGRFVKSLPGRVVGKVKKVVKDRVQAQKNFEDRTDNSNYYKGYKNFIK